MLAFFGGGGEPEYPGENPSEHGQLKARTSNKLNPHKTPQQISLSQSLATIPGPLCANFSHATLYSSTSHLGTCHNHY